MSSSAGAWLTVEEAAAELKVSTAAVERLVQGGAFAAVEIEGSLRIPVSALRDYAVRAERVAYGRRVFSGRRLVGAAAAVLTLAGAAVFAASLPGPGEIVPRQIPYRGVLEKDGAPLTNPSTPMDFFLYTSPTATEAVWSESQNVSVQDGQFTVALGDTVAIPSHLFAQPSLYLSVIVEGQQLTGRQRLLSVPYAQQAAASDASQTAVHAEYADRAGSAASVDSLPAKAVMFFNLTACPSGWTELTSARGRVLVGLNPSGQLAATVGTAFTDTENRSHQHTISHKHGFATSNTGLATSHWWDRKGTANSGYEGTGYFVMDTMSDEVIGEQHSHSLPTIGEPSAEQSGLTAGLVPYIQLLACQKS